MKGVDESGNIAERKQLPVMSVPGELQVEKTQTLLAADPACALEKE